VLHVIQTNIDINEILTLMIAVRRHINGNCIL